MPQRADRNRGGKGAQTHACLTKVARFVATLVLLIAVAACAQGNMLTSTPPSGKGVPASRMARLARCVDITRWFWQVSDTSVAHFTRYIGDNDLILIHRLGFRCVRLSIEPNLLYHKEAPTAPDPVMLRYIDAAVNRLLAHDLAAIIDLHDDPEKPLEQDPDYANGFVAFWHALAHHFAQRNPEMVYLEVLNEPVFKNNPRQWLPIQQRLLRAMRTGAPRLTLIATGPLWSSVDGLLLVRPVADPNVVYTFHFYEPATFTHQGAEWWVDGLDRYMADLPYPSTSKRCSADVTKFTNADVRVSARAYCAGDWGAAKLDGLIARAAQWSKTHGVPIIAGEFGAYCQRAPPPDRLQWFKDVSAAFRKYNIGWTLWGYDECYGLGRHLGAHGNIMIDYGVVRVLGLNANVRSA
jgi:aryl-phospho-beta-D-glucosidase BglC (GH1 family)